MRKLVQAKARFGGLIGLTLAALGCRGLGPGAIEYPILIPPRTISMTGELVEFKGRILHGRVDFAWSPESDLVQLYVRRSFYAPNIALHPFFLVFDHELERWEQWEVWAGDLYGYYENRKSATATYSDGREEREVEFVHRQIGSIRCWESMTGMDLGAGDRVLGQWSGETARRLIEVLRRPEDYAARDDYRIWPGPNSNGYIRWVLAEARVPLDLDPRMVGKDWRAPIAVGITPGRSGVFLDVLTVGAAVGIREGVELHLLGATLGVDLWPPALKTPWGRLGMQESVRIDAP